MSGGHFENCYCIDDYIDEIRKELEKTNRVWSKQMIDDLSPWERDWYKVGEPLVEYNDPEKIREAFKNGIRALSIAACYVHRIDYLICCDDGEDAFHERLQENLREVERRAEDGSLYKWDFDVM